MNNLWIYLENFYIPSKNVGAIYEVQSEPNKDLIQVIKGELNWAY